jgi:hypothetical protein
MYFAIAVDVEGNITGQYAGPAQLPSPWITITQNQFATIVSGSTWSGSAVTVPAARSLTAQQLLAQQAQALIAGGLTVTSTGSPETLNGTYATNAQAQANMLGLVTYINANGKFPGSTGSLTWFDVNGQPHVFLSTAEFMALYTAGLDFVMDCQLVADSGTGSLPTPTATIP